MEGTILLQKHFPACVLGSVCLIFDTGFCKVKSDGELWFLDAVSSICGIFCFYSHCK